MKNLLKFLLITFVATSFFACAQDNGDENGNAEGEEEVSEGITQGMEHYWMEQREEFIDLAESLLDQWEERVDEIEDSEKASDLKNKIDNIRDRLIDLEQSDQEDWEEKREDIASDINDLREEIEDAS